MKAIVWSNVGCSYCEQAKNLLKAKDIEFEERNIAHGTWTVQQLQEAVHRVKNSLRQYSPALLGVIERKGQKYSEVAEFFAKIIN